MSLDLELGVFDPEPYRLLWGDGPTTVTEADCTVRTLIDDLVDIRGAAWWESDQGLDSVASLTLGRGLPWMESMHLLEARVVFLRQRPWLTSVERVILALSELEAGDAAAARQRLSTEVNSGPGSWRERIRGLLELVDDRTT